MFQHEVPPLSRFVDSRGWDGETATTYQSTQLSIYIGPFRLPVGHQALLPYALCIGPNQQGSRSAKTVCFYWQTFGRRFTESTTWGTSGSGGVMRFLSANHRHAAPLSLPNPCPCPTRRTVESRSF